MMPVLRRRRRHLSLIAAGILAVPVLARAAALTLTSQHLTTVSTCGLIAYSSTNGVDTDAYVDQSHATTAEGTGAAANALDVQSSTTANQRTYIRFDLTKCIFQPASTVIVRGAWLILFMTKQGTACRTLDVFPEATAWTDTTITWNNQPNPPGTTLNNPSSTQRTASADIGSPTTCANHTTNQYVAWNVTTDVANYVAGTTTNHGWMIRDDVEGSSTNQQTVFNAINANKNTQCPQLMISYTDL